MARRKGTSVEGRQYYDIGECLSRNAQLNFVVGPRGNGKTYSFKMWAVRDYLKTGGKFIYLRRYSNELQKNDTFFSDIGKEYPNIQFRVNGMSCEISREMNDNGKPVWENFGYMVALSTSQQLKSVPFPDVTKILYDEFLLDTGFVRYIPDEVTKFLDFIVTVDRFRDVGVRAFCMANSTSINNPYFAYFGIRVPENGEFFKTLGGQVVAQFPRSRAYVDEASLTDWGRLIDGSSYKQYALGNVFYDNTSLLLGRKGEHSTCYFAIDNGQYAFSCWNEPPPEDAIWYVESGHGTDGVLTFTTDIENVENNRSLSRGNDYPMKLLVTAYRQGCIRFDSQTTRQQFITASNM